MAEKHGESFMLKLARFIVDKRKAFLMLFLVAIVFCASTVTKVKINNDITAYLDPESETRRGLTIMEEEFTTSASARIMVTSVTYDQGEALAEAFREIEGVSMVDFGQESYKEASALLSVTFAGEENDPEPVAAMGEIKKLLEGFDCYIDSTVGFDYNANLQQEMTFVLIVGSVIILGVLLFTSKSYLEVLVFLLTFVTSAVLNMGTNFWFGEISFVTNAVAVVLQLALAIDYAIIFCHRYMEERDRGLGAREADITALSKAIVEISSSSLTTIAGLVALMLMKFRIGFDMGIVLAKGILCSMLSVFLFMPCLLMIFNRGIEATRHRNFVPHIRSWGRLMVKLRHVLPAIFVVVVAGAFYCSSQCDFCFSQNSVDTRHPSQQRIAQDKIAGVFGSSNAVAVLVPSGDYEKEGALLREVEALPQVNSAMGLANIEFEEGRYLTDKLTPRQFSELAGVDVELARLLFQAYGLSEEEYGAVFQNPDTYAVPLLDIFEFLCEQMDKGVVSLSGEQGEMMAELRNQLDDGMKQLRGENWSRLAFTTDTPEEGEEAYALLDQIRAVAAKYYGDQVVMVGNTTSARDLRDAFSGDNLKISILTALFVMVILLFTFQSVGLPILLVLTIQGSIWINFSFPYLTGTNLFFMGQLIVSAIQMGATIDYAIVITSRYLELKKSMSPKEAAVEALDQSFPTVFTSGSIMTVAGFLIGELTTDPTIGVFGGVLGRGAFISVVLVLSVLPQLLVLGDAIIERTALTLNHGRKQQILQDTVRLDGRVRGRVEGYVDGEFKGIIHGSMDALIESGHREKEDGYEEE